MARGPRLDAPGSLHHVIVRGIERRRIFETERDREDFLDRLETVVTEGKTTCHVERRCLQVKLILNSKFNLIQ
jgi:hypothetical protein